MDEEDHAGAALLFDPGDEPLPRGLEEALP
jgi:hypothetical protein